MATGQFKKKRVGAYPFLSVSFSLSLALLVLGLFGLLIIHATALSELVLNNLEVQVHLSKTASKEDISELRTTLSSKPYVINGDESVSFISKEEAAKRFIQETGEDFNEILSINPLRDVFRVKISSEYAEHEKLKEIKKELEKDPNIYEADFDAGLVSLVNKNLRKVSVVLIAFSLILFITVIILIGNTVRLAMFSQRFLIRSMHLVGATDWFVVRPFLERAALIGLFSAIFADVFLFVLLNYANARIEGLEKLQNPVSLVILFFALIVIGMSMSIVGTRYSVGKFLRMKLDELY